MIEEIPGLVQYLPYDSETANLIAKTVPPTKLKIKKENLYVNGNEMFSGDEE